MAEFHDGPHATPPPADDGPVFLGIRNITDGGRLNLKEVRHIAEADYPRWTRRVVPQEDDIVFSYEATLHRYAIVPSGFRGCLGRRLALIRPDRTVVEPRFLHFLLLGPEWRATVTERTIAGSTVDRIPLTDFADFPVVVPELAYQRQVVGFLAAIDDLIETNRRRVELLEHMAQAIYHEWFVHFRFPGSVEELVDSSLGPIPPSWTVRVAGELFSLDKGVSYKGAFLSEDGRPMINLKCFSAQGGFRFDGLKGYAGPLKPHHLVHSGDVVMANTDLTQAGAIVGRVAAVPPIAGAEELAFSHHVFALRPKGVPGIFLLYALGDRRFRDHARGAASGTTVLGLRRDDVLAYPMLEPPPHLVEAFCEIASAMGALQTALAEANRCLSSLRDLLLPKLVTGEIDRAMLDFDKLVGEAAV